MHECDLAWRQALDKKAAAEAAQAFGERLQAMSTINLVSPGKEKGRTRGLRRIQRVRNRTSLKYLWRSIKHIASWNQTPPCAM